MGVIQDCDQRQLLVPLETKQLLSGHPTYFYISERIRDMPRIGKKLTENKALNGIRRIYVKSQAPGKWLRNKFKLL
jgi:hypothetical protein